MKKKRINECKECKKIIKNPYKCFCNKTCLSWYNAKVQNNIQQEKAEEERADLEEKADDIMQAKRDFADITGIYNPNEDD